MFQNDMRDLKKSLLEGRLYQIGKKIPFLNVHRTKYGDKTIYDSEVGKKLLVDGISSDKPFLAGRFGTSECGMLVNYLRREILHNGHKDFEKSMHLMFNNAGFFPYEEKQIVRYCELVKDLYPYIDLLCIMNTRGESFVVSKYLKNAKLTRLTVVDPLLTHWTYALEGKRVLVVHPFSESIEHQYFNKRDKIFNDKSILPEFELKTVKAVQTVAGSIDNRFKDWFQALEYMYTQCMEKDFDIALIGCGSYGLPLGAMLKKHGKKVVHMGGCLQLLFGIRGSRWDLREDMRNYFNDNWIRPSNDETPKNSKSVENNCYW